MVVSPASLRLPLKPSFPIQAARLLLRPYRPEDYEALFDMQSRADLARWLYWEPRTPDEVRESLAKKERATAVEAEGDVIALVAELRATGEVVGDFVLILVSAEHRQGEIGYIVHPDHQGKGYATEGSRVLLDLAFRDLGLHRVVGRTEARNVASTKVLARLGMRREAHLVENEWVKGEWQSELVYAILAGEWLEQHR